MANETKILLPNERVASVQTVNFRGANFFSVGCVLSYDVDRRVPGTEIHHQLHNKPETIVGNKVLTGQTQLISSSIRKE